MEEEKDMEMMKHPLSRLWRLPPLLHCFARREGDAPSAAGRPLRGGTGLDRADFMAVNNGQRFG